MDLKDLRNRRGLSQGGLGHLTGLVERSIRRIENGERRMPLGRLTMFCEALQCSYQELIYAIGETEAADATGWPGPTDADPG